MGHTIESRKRALNKMKALRKTWVTENGPCRYCGSRKGLQVDHIDPSTKVSHSVWTWREDKRLEELRKCQVLCRDCHSEKTAEEARIRFQVPMNKRQCGIIRKYQLGCRCVKCREVKRMKRMKHPSYRSQLKHP